MARGPSSMVLYSYVVARDYGFAPNPFQGWCTLATCKQKIRAVARVGDWVIGTGAKKNYKFAGRLIYAMRVQEVLSFDDYWNDPRFFSKRPVLNGSLKQLYGDNIYHRDPTGNTWLQADSHHSLNDGQPNDRNIKKDTSADRVLLSQDYVYYGRRAPQIPLHLRQPGNDICKQGPGHKTLSSLTANAFVAWLNGLGARGFVGDPLEFSKHTPNRN